MSPRDFQIESNHTFTLTFNNDEKTLMVATAFLYVMRFLAYRVLPNPNWNNVILMQAALISRDHFYRAIHSLDCRLLPRLVVEITSFSHFGFTKIS